MSKEQKVTRNENENQGEGNREAARHYNRETEKFVKSGKVEEAAEKAADQDPEEAKLNESLGRERAKEEDPAVEREYHKPTDASE